MTGQSEYVAPVGPALTRKTAFSSPGVHPLVLDFLLAGKYGVDWLLWEPESVWSNIVHDFGLQGLELGRHARAGIQATKTIHANDSFWMDWEVTGWCTQVLCGHLPDFEVLQMPSPWELAHAVDCARVLRKRIPYAAEVQKWMAACLLDAGLVFAPPPLDFLQDDIAMVESHCGKCGNVEWPEGLVQCPECGAPRSQLSLRPRWEWEDVKQRWDMVKGKAADDVVMNEDRVGVQLSRLFLIRDWGRERLDLVNAQLKELDLAPLSAE